MSSEKGSKFYTQPILSIKEGEDPELHLYKLESGMRYLYNHVSRLDSTTNEQLKSLGKRLKTLTKTVDKMSKYRNQDHVKNKFSQSTSVRKQLSQESTGFQTSLEVLEMKDHRMVAGSCKPTSTTTTTKSSTSASKKSTRSGREHLPLHHHNTNIEVNASSKPEHGSSQRRGILHVQKDKCTENDKKMQENDNKMQENDKKMQENKKHSESLRSQLLEREHMLIQKQHELCKYRDQLLKSLKRFNVKNIMHPSDVEDTTTDSGSVDTNTGHRSTLVCTNPSSTQVLN